MPANLQSGYQSADPQVALHNLQIAWNMHVHVYVKNPRPVLSVREPACKPDKHVRVHYVE